MNEDDACFLYITSGKGQDDQLYNLETSEIISVIKGCFLMLVYGFEMDCGVSNSSFKWI